jgi:cytochrome c553
MLRVLTACAALCVALPQTTLAASATLQDFAEAVRATPNLEHGATLFRQCAQCHGVSGGGAEDGSIPRIAGQHVNVLIRQLVDYRHNERWDVRMEHHAGRKLLADSQSLADVAAYASALSRDQPRKVGDGSLVKRGAAVFAARCASCHGRQGEGNNSAVIPRVSGQHYDYLLRQMYDAVDGRRPNFSAAHIRLLAKLERADLVGVADFLARADWTGPSEPLAYNLPSTGRVSIRNRQDGVDLALRAEPVIDLVPRLEATALGEVVRRLGDHRVASRGVDDSVAIRKK